jgi:hypothetical protein
MMKRSIVLISAMWILLVVRPGISCSAAGVDVTSVIGKADLILRATAVEYIGPELPIGARRLWNSNIRFSIEEIVKGTYEKRDLILPGFLTDVDEWNGGASPYKGARPSADDPWIEWVRNQVRTKRGESR